MNRPHRLVAYSRSLMPRAWVMLERALESRFEGKHGLFWPEYSLVPVEVGKMVVEQSGVRVDEVAVSGVVLATLASWSVTQGVYALDRTLQNSLSADSRPIRLSRDAFGRMPEPCIYVELDFVWRGRSVVGAFAMQDHDHRTGDDRLIVAIIDSQDEVISTAYYPLAVGETLDHAVARKAESMVRGSGITDPTLLAPMIASQTELYMSLLQPVFAAVGCIASGAVMIRTLSGKVPYPPDWTTCCPSLAANGVGGYHLVGEDEGVAMRNAVFHGDIELSREALRTAKREGATLLSTLPFRPSAPQA